MEDITFFVYEWFNRVILRTIECIYMFVVVCVSVPVYKVHNNIL